MQQLCLNLGTTPVRCGGRTPRPIPDVVKELFELSTKSPSGLVLKEGATYGNKKAGESVGSLTSGKSKYYLVYVTGHGSYYAHRIAYYLEHNSNPDSMVVRHTEGTELILGYQDDNLRDEKGKRKKQSTGYRTSRMYSYKGAAYNLTRLCEVVGVKRYKANYKLLQGNTDAATVFMELGVPGVASLF